MKKFKYRILFNLITSLLFSLSLTLLIYIITYYLQTFQAFDHSTRLIILAFMFIVILFITFASLLNYSFSYIEQLVSIIQDVANGNFDVAIPIEQEDEFGYIAKNVNQMAYELKKAKEKEDYSLYKERLVHLASLEEEKKTHDLITNVAHDLKTPLTSMMGYLQLLNDHPEFSQEKQAKYLKIAYDKCTRLHRLINDLFHYSAFSSKQVQFQPQKINISELVSQMADEYYTELENQHLSLMTDISNPTIYVNADGELMARVFDNLMNNAIKYHEDGNLLKLTISEDTSTVSIVVSNTAKPMTRDDLDHIFEKFYRTDLSRNSKTGGTGLGLAISKSIVEMHEGEIFATYQKGWLNLIVVLKKYS